MSYLAWIDFDPEERRRAQTLIDLFKQQEARDELGLGTVRDGLADILFPGTSTIQTRLRYMLFIPWIYREAQQRKGSQTERIEIARGLEFQISEALQRSGETTGVIGIEAGRNLKRLASSVYWAGLQTLGIRTLSGSQATFLSYGPESLKDHDLQLWASGIPDRPDDLFEKADFKLFEKEAAFLRDRLAIKARTSLLNELARKEKSIVAEWPWHVAEDTVSDVNRAVLRHAERFSSVMYGASLLYNLLLAIRSGERPNAKTHANANVLQNDYSVRIENWQNELEHLALKEWELDDLYGLIGTTTHKLTVSSKDFIRHWVDLVRTEPASLTTNPRAIDLLKQREHGLKRMKARLLYDAPLERWSGAAGDARLDFRWRTASKYLEELTDVG